MSFKDFLAIIVYQVYNQGDRKWGGRTFQYYVKRPALDGSVCDTTMNPVIVCTPQNLLYSEVSPLAKCYAECDSMTVNRLLCWHLDGGVGRGSASKKSKPISRISIYFCENISPTLPG